MTDTAPVSIQDTEAPPDEVSGDVLASEVVTGEVVPSSPPMDSVDHKSPPSAIERAAEAAMLPGAPGRDEFLSLAQQARLLTLSAGAPKAIKNNPYLALHVVLIGRDYGISPTAAMSLVDVIGRDGDPHPQISVSPQLRIGQVQRLGLGAVVPFVRTPTRCVAVAVAPGGHLDPRCVTAAVHVEGCSCVILGQTEFTWDDAIAAGLVQSDCLPGAHKVPPGKNKWGKDNTCSCRQGWRNYPKRMLWWRAGGYAVDDFFPSASMGVYSPDELGAVVDAEGHAIDPGSVELPPGYEVKTAATPDGELASEEEVAALSRSIRALPEEYRHRVVDLMKEREMPKLADCNPGQVRLLGATVRGFVAEVRRTDYDYDAAFAALDDPAGSPEAPAGAPPAPAEGSAPSSPPEWKRTATKATQGFMTEAGLTLAL